MVPNGWIREKILDLATDERNSFVIGPFGSDLVQSDYRTSGIPIVFVRDIKRNKFEWISNVYVEIEKAEALKAHSVKPGDIVITKMGLPPGLAAVYPNEQPSGVVTADIIRLRPDPNKVDSDFLCALLNSEDIQEQVYQRTAGQTRPKLTLADYKSIHVNIPPLNRQKKIAKILSTWDKAITTTEQLLANSQQQKMALMQQLLTGKKRLLDKNGVRFSGEWKKYTFSQFGKCIRGVSYKPDDICVQENDSTVRLLRSTNIQNGCLNDKELVILPKESVKPSQILKKGDLAICMANGSKALVGKSAPFKDGNADYTVGAFCAIFRPLKGVSSSFVKFVFESSQYQSQLLVILAGSSINNLKGLDIEAMKILVPTDSNEQQKIAYVLSTADQEITALQQKLAALKQEKKALMQQLLTGKRRVRVEEAA